MSVLNDTLVMVLAGERGGALGALTRERAKAAVPFGGEYRIVDFVLSNCLHSGLRRIYVLTQYNAHSLHEHLRSAWGVYNPELDEFVTPVPPRQHDAERWYEGSAQALAENLFLIKRSRAARVLLLSGVHIYRMDYESLLQAHVDRGAEISVACLRTSMSGAAGLDLLGMDQRQRICAVEPARARSGANADESGPVTVSMEVLVVQAELLTELLESGLRVGSASPGLAAQLLPELVSTHRVVGYPFGGAEGRVSQDRYFSQVASLDAYFDANMALLEPVPPLDLYQTDWPIWSHSRRLPPARTVASRQGNEGIFVNSIVSNGTVVIGGAVSHSVLGPRVRIADSAVVERCILFDGVEVGEGAELRNCVIDKHARIERGARIGFDHATDAGRFEVTAQGRVVVPREYPEATTADASAGDLALRGASR